MDSALPFQGSTPVVFNTRPLCSARVTVVPSGTSAITPPCAACRCLVLPGVTQLHATSHAYRSRWVCGDVLPLPRWTHHKFSQAHSRSLASAEQDFSVVAALLSHQLTTGSFHRSLPSWELHDQRYCRSTRLDASSVLQSSSKLLDC